MRKLTTFAIAIMLAGSVMAQTPGGRPSGGPPANERAPGTAASDVSPGRPTEAPGSDSGKRSDARQHDAARDSRSPKADEARRANRGTERSASAAQSYGYPAPAAQGR